MNSLRHKRRDFVQKSVYFGAAAVAIESPSKAFIVKPGSGKILKLTTG